MNRIRIATRKSPLALWQAEYVKAALESAHPGLEVELLTFTTRGDRILDTPLAKIGGKGLFVKELEHAMLAGEADIAVHSMKDVPMAFPPGLGLVAICEREDPSDAFVSSSFASFSALPEGARVGTSSLRRQCQLLAQRPDLQLLDLRGNVNTRLAKLDAGEFDAIILATAGLKRLDMQHRIAEILAPSCCLPAGGQGAVGIEARTDDQRVTDLLQSLHHPETSARVLAERALNRHLEGGCQVPIACFAEVEGDSLWLRGLVGSLDGRQMLRSEGRAPLAEAEALGTLVAEKLLAQGAAEILAGIHEQQ